jgi:hypothetical protein
MKTYAIIAAAGLQALALQAQVTVTTNGPAFQYMLNAPGPDDVGFKMVTLEGVTGKAVTGHPFSATEQRHTVQTLGDGTKIENKDSNKYFRDDQGRTRIERSNGAVVIHDPVQGMSAEVNNHSNRVVRQDKFAYSTGTAAVSEKLAAEKLASEMKAVHIGVGEGMGMGVGRGVASDAATQADKVKMEAAMKAQAAEEDLGYQSINGVSAQGFRRTTTIPVGQIGNDRPLQIVSERWYSPELQMNVKTVNTDPRFGVTTYELTNIVQAAQDPSLFAMPENVSSDKVR